MRVLLLIRVMRSVVSFVECINGYVVSVMGFGIVVSLGVWFLRFGVLIMLIVVMCFWWGYMMFFGWFVVLLVYMK